MKSEVIRWWKQAQRDLKAAKNSFRSGDYYVASLLCQQSVEKGFKSLLINKDKDIPKVHDLVFLSKKLNAEENIVEESDKLSKIYVETKYPDVSERLPYEKFTKEKAKEHIKIAGELLKWIKARI